jgi:hypothetical protein
MVPIYYYTICVMKNRFISHVFRPLLFIMWTVGSKKTHRVISNVPLTNTLSKNEREFVDKELLLTLDTNFCEVLQVKWQQGKEIKTIEDVSEVVTHFVKWHSNASLLIQEEFCVLCQRLVGFYNEMKTSSKDNKKPCFSLNECSKYLRAFREQYNRVIRVMNLRKNNVLLVSNRLDIKEKLDSLKTKVFRCAKVLCTIVNFIHTDSAGNPLHCSQNGMHEIKDEKDKMDFRMSFLESIDDEVNCMAPLVINGIEEMFNVLV